MRLNCSVRVLIFHMDLVKFDTLEIEDYLYSLVASFANSLTVNCYKVLKSGEAVLCLEQVGWYVLDEMNVVNHQPIKVDTSSVSEPIIC